MTVQLYAFTCGFLTIPRAFMLQGEKGLITVPAPSYLFVHAKGRVLFDSGLHAATLEKMHTPGVIADREAALAVFRRLREMQARGAQIMYGHDPDFWQSVPQAPVRLG